MKQLIINRIVPGLMLAGLFVVWVYGESKRQEKIYHSGYQDAIQCYRQWLIDVDYAEYNKKTGEWQLVDANSIQGNLIEPQRRPLFVHVDDHIQALEHELQVARKQQSANKRQVTKLDIKKLP